MSAAAVRREDDRAGADTVPSVCFVCPTRSAAELLTGSPNADIGGAEVQMTHLASALARRGHTASCLVAGEGCAAEQASPDGVRVITAYELTEAHAGVSWLTRKWPGLWRAMSRADADVYITRGANWHTGAAVLFARLQGRSSVFWVASEDDVLAADREGGLPSHARVCFRYGLDRCDALVAQTRTQQRLVAERLGREATLIPNMWIPADGMAPAVTRDDRGVLWVGNIRPRKRPEMALEVAALLPDVHLTMVGGPVPGAEDLDERVRARAAALGNVTVAGHVPHEQVHEFYQRAAILLHTAEVEGFPNVFLEAWGHGLPVVSTFDPDGMIASHDLGRAAQTRDGLATGITELLTERAKHEVCRLNASRYVREYHDPAAVADAAERVLRSLV